MNRLNWPVVEDRRATAFTDGIEAGFGFYAAHSTTFSFHSSELGNNVGEMGCFLPLSQEARGGLPGCFATQRVGRELGRLGDFCFDEGDGTEERHSVLNELVEQGYVNRQSRHAQTLTGPRETSSFEWSEEARLASLLPDEATKYNPLRYAGDVLKADWLHRQSDHYYQVGMERGIQLARCAECAVIERCRMLSAPVLYVAPSPVRASSNEESSSLVELLKVVINR